MFFKKTYFCIFILPLFFISCLHSKTSPQAYTGTKSVRVNHGSAVLKIYGEIADDLYFEKQANSHDTQAIKKGAITKNETRRLSAGEEYQFSLLPTELVTIIITSSDGKDVDISTFDRGKERKFTLRGSNRSGLFLAFQNSR